MLNHMIDRGPFRRRGIEDYIKRLNTPREKPILDSTVVAILKRAKIEIPDDPASIYDPDQLWAQLDRYGEPETYDHDEWMQKAVASAFKVFGYRESYGKLTPLELETDFMKAIKMEKHAGVYMSDKATAWPRAWTRSFDILEGRKKPNPCLAGVRTQRGNKTRLVWMYPLDMTILEAKFAYPLIEMYKNVRTPMPYSLRRYELGARLESTLDRRNKVALDFSKFDSSVPKRLIHTAFAIMKTWFDMEEGGQTEHCFKIVRRYFVNTPIVMHDGHMYTGKRKGVPSGSFFTQLVDSIVNYIVVTAAMFKFNLHPHSRRVHVLGDDSVFSTDEDINLKQMRAFFKTKGFNLNTDKSEVARRDESIHFLGFDWKRGVPFKDREKLIAGMTQPENWRKRMKDYVEESTRAHRLILEMCTLSHGAYGIAGSVFGHDPKRLNYVNPEGNVKNLSGFSRFNLETNPTGRNFWRNISTGLWI